MQKNTPVNAAADVNKNLKKFEKLIPDSVGHWRKKKNLL